MFITSKPDSTFQLRKVPAPRLRGRNFPHGESHISIYMKGRGIKLLHLWIAAILVNTAIPALCAGLAASGVCPPSETARSGMSCQVCPQAKSEKPTELPDCCEIRAMDLSQSWHQEKPVTVAVFTLIPTTSGSWIDLSALCVVAVLRLEEHSSKLQECDVGAHQPRAPPFACV
jgi:hypothetical protein